MDRLPILRASGEGRTIGLVGDVYRFLATGAETGGRYALFEACIPPGGGPPPHIHSREEESFYVLDGEVTFQVDNQRVVAKVGMFASVPIGCPHSFRNESGHPARMLITVAPAGLDDFFLEVGRPLPPNSVAAPPPTADDITRLVEVAPRYGITILPPPQ
ncbi:MAG: quercetin 2,3-dioxygenase [Planctomycetaceae bacterium]